MKPPKRRRNPPARDFSQPRATKKAKNGQSQRRNEPDNVTTHSDNHDRPNANSNAIQANSSRSMSSIPQHQYSSVDDGPSYHPASDLGQSVVPSEGLLPIQVQPNISGHQGTLVTSAPSVGPIHQTLQQTTNPGPNAEMCSPANSGSVILQGTRQPPAFYGTSSSSDAHVKHRKTPENQINPPVQNLEIQGTMPYSRGETISHSIPPIYNLTREAHSLINSSVACSSWKHIKQH